MRVFFISLFLLAACFSSCKENTSEKTLSDSVGKYGEILVVVDTIYEKGSTGEILHDIFRAEVKGLPQIEPMFRMNTVPNSGFSSILQSARNVVKIEVSNKLKAEIAVEEDVWANDQLVIYVRGKSIETVNDILKSNKQALRGYFNRRELERLEKQNSASLNTELSAKLAEQHNLTLDIPPGFLLMESRDNDFWIRKEKTIGNHQIIQGLMVYYYPYESDSAFSVGEMIMRRNDYTYNHIEGELDSSYMAVYEEYRPYIDTLTINEMYAVEYRGLWNMKNDFMGGPFLHYTVLDEKYNRIINIDAFVYAPKFNKREYLRELEAVAKTLQVQ